MKIKLSTSELYPVYGEHDWTSSGGMECEIDEDLWKAYSAAKEEFFELLNGVEDVVLDQHRNGI